MHLWSWSSKKNNSRSGTKFLIFDISCLMKNQTWWFDHREILPETLSKHTSSTSSWVLWQTKPFPSSLFYYQGCPTIFHFAIGKGCDLFIPIFLCIFKPCRKPLHPKRSFQLHVEFWVTVVIMGSLEEKDFPFMKLLENVRGERWETKPSCWLLGTLQKVKMKNVNLILAAHKSLEYTLVETKLI